jgi:hypothetical protein
MENRKTRAGRPVFAQVPHPHGASAFGFQAFLALAVRGILAGAPCAAIVACGQSDPESDAAGGWDGTRGSVDSGPDGTKQGGADQGGGTGGTDAGVDRADLAGAGGNSEASGSGGQGGLGGATGGWDADIDSPVDSSGGIDGGASVDAGPVGPIPQGFQKNVSTSRNDLVAVANGNKVFVAVGYDGTVKSSSDGTNWTVASTDIPGDVTSVAYNNGTFYIVGATPNLAGSSKMVTATVYSSTDTSNWTALATLDVRTNSYFSTPIISVANGKLFMGGNEEDGSTGALWSSPDAKTWTRMTIFAPFTNFKSLPFERVIWVNGQYVALSASVSWASTDSVNWTRTGFIGGHWPSLAYGAGKFVGTSSSSLYLQASSDLVTWSDVLFSPATDTFPFRIVLFNNGFKATTTGGGRYLSDDGVTWTPASPPNGGLAGLMDVVAGDETYVGVGTKGLIGASADFSTWTASSPAGATAYVMTAFGADKFLLSDGKTLATSMDGATWTTVANTRTYSHLKFLNDAFYAFGNGTTVEQSKDGTTWSNASSGIATSPADIAFGAGKFVLLDSGYITTFTNLNDPNTWAQKLFQNPGGLYGPEVLDMVAFGNSTFVAVSSSGGVCNSISAAAGTWTCTQNAMPYLLSQVTGSDLSSTIAFGNGIFIAITHSGAFASAKGVTWTSVTGLPSDSGQGIINFANGQFFFTSANGMMLSSADGNTWTPVQTNTTNRIYQIAYGNGRYVAGGAASTILTSK